MRASAPSSEDIFRELVRSSEELQDSLKDALATAYLAGHRTARIARMIRQVSYYAASTLAACLLLDLGPITYLAGIALASTVAMNLYLRWRTTSYPKKQTRQLVNRIEFEKHGQKLVVRVRPQPRANPPRGAEVIIALLAKPQHRESRVGDANEQFHRDLARYGLSRARTLYWCDALRSVWPIAWRRLKRAGLGTGFVAAALVLIERLL